MESFSSSVPNIISIGSSCRSRFQIERYLKNLYPDIGYPSFFWDWLYYGGADGVIWTLENDFLLNPLAFDIIANNHSGKFQLRHSPSQLVFLHDFGEHETEAAALQALEGKWCEVFEKYAFLAARTKKLLCSKIMPLMFVYQGSLRLDQVSRLSELLGIGSGANILVNVLQVGERCDVKGGDGFMPFHVDDEASGKSSDHWWEGCDASWNKGFDSLAEKPGFKDVADAF